jgi:glycerol-3-phosphate dehydrogenase
MASFDAQVAVIGAGVVGSAVAASLAARGVSSILVEAEREPGTGASGANSGILHTGFDSVPGELETRLILRSAELRRQQLGRLGVPVVRCGARLRAHAPQERRTIAALARNAGRNGVEVRLERDGELVIPGEAITDPARFTLALAALAAEHGATLRSGVRVVSLDPDGAAVLVGLSDGARIRVAAVANCAGLDADEVAGLAGERPFEVYPRKGEFLVFEQPRGRPLGEILLPVPSKMGKGVLVFPTVDGHVIAGPTARDRLDKRDRSVEPDAGELILARARSMFPPLQDAEPVAAYAGLRPAGREVNYAIGPSAALPALVNVAAIRSTGLSAALGIGEHVAVLLARAGGFELGPVRELTLSSPPPERPPWWQAASTRSAVAA